LKNLLGCHFGRLTVIGYAGKDKENHSKWLCRCECGNSTAATGYNLEAGKILSCGCLRREQAGRLNYKDGRSNTRLYSIYRNMLLRTENPKVDCFKFYGGRGIKICSEWRHDFQAFRAWSLSHGYQENLSIDRIDNDKGYSPENCRWVTDNAQFNNRRSNCAITFRGETKTKAEWARAIGIDYHTLCTRLNDGWSFERAILTPAKKGTRTA
jgi:hypothetical protein